MKGTRYGGKRRTATAMTKKAALTPRQSDALDKRAGKLVAEMREWDRLQQQNQYPRSLHGICRNALLRERAIVQRKAKR